MKKTTIVILIMTLAIFGMSGTALADDRGNTDGLQRFLDGFTAWVSGNEMDRSGSHWNGHRAPYKRPGNMDGFNEFKRGVRRSLGGSGRRSERSYRRSSGSGNSWIDQQRARVNSLCGGKC